MSKRFGMNHGEKERGLRANVPKTWQLLIFTCQRANLPCRVPMFQLSVSTCQTACHFFKLSSYKMLREISILYYYIKYSTLYLISWLYISYVYVSYIKNLLYFISMLHIILKRSVWNFLLFFIIFLFLFFFS